MFILVQTKTNKVVQKDKSYAMSVVNALEFTNISVATENADPNWETVMLKRDWQVKHDRKFNRETP